MSEAASPGSAGDDAHHRRIRSFVTRAGRISVAQQRALDLLLPRYGVPYADSPLDFDHVFGRHAPVVLEIGFGMGETTIALAQARPDVNFFGIEVHTPGVGALLKEVGLRDIQNIRIAQHDAVEVVEHMVPEGSLDGIHVFFPDPWHKARHHKRRLLQPGLVALLASRLKAGGYLHCATDWEHYAEQMAEVLSREPQLVRREGHASRQNPLITRPATKFEARGLRLGHGVWDFIAIKRQGAAED